MMDPKMVYAVYKSATKEQIEQLVGIAVLERAKPTHLESLPERQLAMEAIMLLDELRNGT